ncbi:hypothetical protein QQG55_47305 [Brugia pahangi]
MEHLSHLTLARAFLKVKRIVVTESIKIDPSCYYNMCAVKYDVRSRSSFKFPVESCTLRSINGEENVCWKLQKISLSLFSHRAINLPQFHRFFEIFFVGNL